MHKIMSLFLMTMLTLPLLAQKADKSNLEARRKKLNDLLAEQWEYTLETSPEFATIIGDCVTVGHAAVLHGCTIKNRVLVGIGAIILDNVTVGEESFIAAGALVTPGTVIPPRSMVMGSPAKVRREVTDDEVALIHRHWQSYVEYKATYQSEFGG